MSDPLRLPSRPSRRARPSRRRGSVLIASLAVALILAALSASMLTIVHSSNVESQGDRDDLMRTSIAQSAAGFAEVALLGGGEGDLGSEQAPIAFGEGAYWTEATKNADHTLTVVCYGQYRGGTKAIAAVYMTTPGLFDNAIFAGNSSGDPTYALKFGGKGSEADAITGDVFSGGDVAFSGSATIKGTPRATGKVTGKPGEGGVSQAMPDLGAMHYDTIADVDVAKNFKAASYKSDDAGGKAWQLPESDPAHIFRKNPSDRDAEWKSTTKEDYFLEDPYEDLRTDPKSDGSDPYVVSVAGSLGNPGSDGNKKIYFIDGNLWIHNKSAMSFRLAADGDLAVTIVVKGNIYISDNIFYDSKKNDGLALISMKDAAVPDSGNIYFGDPSFGTLEHMSAYMYAENNFFDTNLSASGSAKVSVDGIMSAGNQVAIDRDYKGHHSKLTVTFDPRVQQGLVDLPGLPSSAEAAVTFLAWLGAASQP